MILRRIGDAIRRQDWFVVLVEVLVVVFGVFIGLQVDDWQKDRENRALEQQYLERLFDDMNGTIEDFNRYIAWDQRRMNTQQLVLDSLRAGTLRPEDRESFELGLAFAGSINPIRRRWGTIEELKNTGNIALLRDIDLRNLIARVEGVYFRNQTIVQLSQARIIQLKTELVRHYDILAFQSVPEAAEVDFDFEKLANNKEFISLFADLQLASDTLTMFNLFFVNSVAELRNHLALALGKDPTGLVQVEVKIDRFYDKPLPNRDDQATGEGESH